jgi:CMP-N,N'-diacetyllegionaminic acid synthase
MKISCIILARAGSKGIPKKNIVDFCGKPLISWTILQALEAKEVHDVWVSSDSDEILAVAKHYGANTIIRPKRISGDYEPSESAWLHAIDYIKKKSGYPIDYVLAPQVTSPLRHASDFSNAIIQIKANGYDSLLSVAEIEDFFIWKKERGKNPESVNYDFKDRQHRQKIKKKYLENGSFYLFKPQVLINKKNRLGGDISLFIMDKYKMFQIDSFEDIKLASVIMKGFNLNKP